MSAPTNRWTLMQALAWVATRDRAFVERLIEEPVRPDDHAVPVTHTQLIVRIRGAGFPAPPADVDRPLVDMIAQGAVPADGEPGSDFDNRTDRSPVDRAARGCRIDSGRWDDPEGFYLEPEGEHQNKWYGVEVDVEALLREFPGDQPTPSNVAVPALAQVIYEPPKKRFGNKPALQRAVISAFERLWPNGLPEGMAAQHRDDLLKSELKALGRDVSPQTIRRALSDR